jgi:iron complex outermembrane receptor protein
VKDIFTFNSGSTPNQNQSTLFQLNARYGHSFSAKTQLISGLQVQNKKIESNDRGDHKILQTAAYVLLNQTFGENLLIAPSLRIDNTENSGTELVPQLNISYKTGLLQWRGSIGKTIRQADFTERYNNYNKTLVTSGSIGNPNLEAERSLSYEVGMDLFIKSNWRISSTLFKRDQQKMIDWATTSYTNMPRKSNLIPTGIYALASNIAKVNTAGFETDVQYQQQWSNGKKIVASMGMVWLDSKVLDGIPSFYISSHAKFLVNASVVYTCKSLQLSSNAIYKIRTAAQASAINADLSENYLVMNFRALVFVKKQKAGLFVEATNLFNASYSDLLGAPMPGRWLLAGFNLAL